MRCRKCRTLGACSSQAEHAAIAGDLASADELLRSAARIQEAELGPLHPDLVNTLNNLGIVAEKTGRPGDAEAFYRRAAATASASLPSDHPIVADSRQNPRRLLPRARFADRCSRCHDALGAGQRHAPSSGTPSSVARPSNPDCCPAVAACTRRTSRSLAWVAIGVVVLVIAALLVRRAVVAARNVDADTDGSIHGAAGRRASAAASRHARSDRTGTTAEGRTAWQRSGVVTDKRPAFGAFSGGASAWPLPNCAGPFRRAAATGDAIR